MTHKKHSSGGNRRESRSSYHQNSPQKTDVQNKKGSPPNPNREYSDYSRSDHELSGRGYSFNDSVETRSRDREKCRERDAKMKRSMTTSCPGRRSQVTQSSTQEEPATKKRKDEQDLLLTRTKGVYILPAELRMMQEQITDKNSLAYQRMSWEALKKSINGLINKVNNSKISVTL